MPASFQLADGAYACLAGTQLVFSDLRADQYRCLSATDTLAALELFPDLSSDNALTSRGCLPTNDGRTETVARALVEKGLLIPRSCRNQPRRGNPPRLPLEDLRDVDRQSNLSGYLRNLPKFFLASLKASRKLSHHPLYNTVKAVERRRVKRQTRALQATERFRDLTAVFRVLRPYYPRGYLCRFDSLALVEFLALHHLYPWWVFGVRTRPFAAHCWVQKDDLVLNDTVDYVSQFTPLMAF